MRAAILVFLGILAVCGIVGGALMYLGGEMSDSPALVGRMLAYSKWIIGGSFAVLIAVVVFAIWRRA